MAPRSARRRLARAISDARSLLRAGRRGLGPHPVAEVEAVLAEAEAALASGDEARIGAAAASLDDAGVRHLAPYRKGAVREFAEVVLAAVVLAVLLRLFVIEAFRIPSGSMIPTLLPGDQILVLKFAYGLRLPLGGPVLWQRPGPVRGDVIVFESPVEPGRDLVKRVAGVEGDVVELVDEVVHVNGVPQPRREVLERFDHWNRRDEPGGWFEQTGRLYVEELGEARHEVVQSRVVPRPRPTEGPFAVPPGHVFVLGDNRDASDDGRAGSGWYVPLDGVAGRALGVFWSQGRGDREPAAEEGVRTTRLGRGIDALVPGRGEAPTLDAAADALRLVRAR